MATRLLRFGFSRKRGSCSLGTTDQRVIAMSEMQAHDEKSSQSDSQLEDVVVVSYSKNCRVVASHGGLLCEYERMKANRCWYTPPRI